MSYKQGLNGAQGEDRTRQILGKNFKYSVSNIDIDGRDFDVELLPKERISDEINRIKVIGRVQAKFFEKNNEVKIAREYVMDNEGVRTDFFALLHTDLNDDEICYFFDAEEIKNNFRIRNNYFVFSLTKERQFETFKNLKKTEINDRIEAGILSTEEYRNQKFIKEIEKKYKTPNPTKPYFNNYNNELFERVKNKKIIDKLYESLTEYKDFRRIISWRLIEKISFIEKENTSTFYNRFILVSNHSEIVNFFNNLEITNEIIIKNKKVFDESNNFRKKVSQIIQVLNKNLIFTFKNSINNSSQNIRLEDYKSCNCSFHYFDSFLFSKTFSTLENNTSSFDLWEQLKNAFVWFKLGKYEKSQKLFIELSESARENKKETIYFFAKFNEKLCARKNFDEDYPDLSIELDKLNINEEKREILKSIADYSLQNDYSQSIDDIYLKIKDYKERNIVNDTNLLVNKLYARIAEYLNFFEGNWLLINDFEESNILFEKVIESCIISYSLQTDYSNHLDHFDDFLVKLALQYCDPNKLLGYFQRNHVNKLPYKKGKSDYFQKTVINLFSKENTDFFNAEICYLNHKTKNIYLRRKVNKLFDNIFILLTYLEHDIDLCNFLENVIYFIDKLDFDAYDISILSHLILSKPELFREKDIIKLSKLLISRKNLSKGYILTNCIYSLKEKNVKINDDDFINELITQAIFQPQYGLLEAIKHILEKQYLPMVEKEVNTVLKDNFNYSLYYHAVISNSISSPITYIDSYLDLFESTNKKNNLFSRNRSPYTGVKEPLRGGLNELVDVLITINDKQILQKPTVQKIMNNYPYYDFILKADSFKKGDNFNVYWILENQSNIVLNNLSSNSAIKSYVREFIINKYDKRLSKIVHKYFYP